MEKSISAKLKGGATSDVYFSTSLKELEEKILSYGENVLYVFDDNTEDLIDVPKARKVVLPHGEIHKDYTSIGIILDKAMDLSLARDSIFIAIGGGVICDMTAFASSIYMRGARCVLVPTTLLSMVDASVGGKSGIDYRGAKNNVGTFFPAEDIIICLEALKTLNNKEYLCGLGEVVKHALLSPDDTLYDFMLENRDGILERDISIMLEMVRLSLLVKKHYIELDPEEKKGIRSALNLGHTFSHALEIITDYSISHGEGVAWGLYRALELGVNLKITPDEYAKKAIRLLSLFPFDESYRVSNEDLNRYLDAIKKDKKKSNNSVKFILLKGQGMPERYVVDDEDIKSVVTC